MALEFIVRGILEFDEPGVICAPTAATLKKIIGDLSKERVLVGLDLKPR